MGLNKYSDYGSGSSSESTSRWDLQDTWEGFSSRLQENGYTSRPRSSSFADIEAKSRLEANMEEFRRNGFDSPYEPEAERPLRDNTYGGLGPSSAYLRQKSWPAPEVTPGLALPRADWALPSQDTYQRPLEDIEPLEVGPSAGPWDSITEGQMQVLRSLPNDVLYSLLRQIEQSREQQLASLKRHDQNMECRFCKNNGERASFYRSHTLRSRGRVACPVLRAFVCRRCGAHGDRAHTLKYCPLATADERKQSTAIMQSLRMASGRRRHATPALDLIDDYVVQRCTPPLPPSSLASSSPLAHDCPLDPIWEALERKLML